ncbi:MAG: hypothetical protein PHQ20_01625 [Candidatus Moranbacteria bacterium]|nr:hypothetical protein [Candidatus Moranbacteria bacterium]
MKKLAITSFLMALGEGIYIFLVALLMLNGEKLFGPMPGVFGLMTFLLLFVVSAAVSGALIMGKPVLLYMSGKKKEAIRLFGATLGWLAVFLLVLLAVLAA